MLAAARARGMYDALHEADLLDFLPRHPGRFDLIAAADVLNYLGGLRLALQGIAGALAAGGHAAFSIETGATADYTLGQGLRYRHDADRVASWAEAAGLTEEARSPAVLRREQGEEVMGMLFVFRRAGP
jgi:predicted TPR repeat methyltransferase